MSAYFGFKSIPIAVQTGEKTGDLGYFMFYLA
jgi:hypothetical protein